MPKLAAQAMLAGVQSNEASGWLWELHELVRFVAALLLLLKIMAK